MRHDAIWPVACLVLWCAVGPTDAQTVTTGTRAIAGVFTGPPRPATDASPSLRLLIDFGGGYDENVDPAASPGVPLQVFNPQQSGYVGNATGSLLYRQGTEAKYIEGNGNAYYSGASSGAEEVAGASVSARTRLPVGRRNGLSANVDLSYDPTYLFNAFGPIAENVEGGVVPGTRPPRGITEQRWINAQGRMGFQRNWTPRQQTNAVAGTQRREPLSGPGFESSMLSGNVRHSWNVKQHAILASSLGYVENLQRTEAGTQRAITSQTAEVSATLLRPWSPYQSVRLTMSGGLNRSRQTADGESFELNSPIIAGLVRLDLSRNWSVSLDARRDITILNGITPEPFESSVVSMRSTGAVGARLQMSTSASYTRGAAAVSTSGSFENLVGTVQLQYAVSSWCALFSNYSYYQHRFRGVEVQAGIPNRYELNSLRAGVTLGVPIF